MLLGLNLRSTGYGRISVNHYATTPPRESETCLKGGRRKKKVDWQKEPVSSRAVLFHIPLSVCGAALSIRRLGLAVQSGPLFFITLRQVW